MKTAMKPLTCKLTAPELQERKRTVIGKLKALILERKELENGLKLASEFFYDAFHSPLLNPGTY